MTKKIIPLRSRWHLRLLKYYWNLQARFHKDYSLRSVRIVSISLALAGSLVAWLGNQLGLAPRWLLGLFLASSVTLLVIGAILPLSAWRPRQKQTLWIKSLALIMFVVLWIAIIGFVLV